MAIERRTPRSVTHNLGRIEVNVIREFEDQGTQILAFTVNISSMSTFPDIRISGFWGGRLLSCLTP